MVRPWGPNPTDGNDRLLNHSIGKRGIVVRAEMVENRSSEMSVGMLCPASAAEVCGADAGRYNAVAILP